MRALRYVRRTICMLLACLMLLCSVGERPRAAVSVYFTAVNDTLLDLNAATMPFFWDGILYVPHSVFSDGSLGISTSLGRDKKTLVLYRKSDVLVFDTDTGSVTDSRDTLYEDPPILRADYIFVPVEQTMQFFGLQYSYVAVEYGHIVRIKNGDEILDDKLFFASATSAMEYRYDQYVSTHSFLSKGETDKPVEDVQENKQSSVYPIIPCTDASAVQALMDRLSDRSLRASFLVTEEFLESAADTLRCMTATGHTVILSVDAAGGAEQARTSIERMNRLLWNHTNRMTRLLLLKGADDLTAAALQDAGYCPARIQLDLSGGESGRSAADRIVTATNARRGVCRVLLSNDTILQRDFSSLLSRLWERNCRLRPCNELTA